MCGISGDLFDQESIKISCCYCDCYCDTGYRESETHLTVTNYSRQRKELCRDTRTEMAKLVNCVDTLAQYFFICKHSIFPGLVNLTGVSY